MTLHGYAQAKLFDNSENKTGHEISYKEWAYSNIVLGDYAQGNRDEATMATMDKYEAWRNMGMTTIYNYEEALKKQQQ